jgi:hypothetical protein
MRTRTWKVLRWSKPEGAKTFHAKFRCQRCGTDAQLETGSQPVAQMGAGLIFEPGHPSWAIPEVIQCRHCRAIWEK